MAILIKASALLSYLPPSSKHFHSPSPPIFAPPTFHVCSQMPKKLKYCPLVVDEDGFSSNSCPDRVFNSAALPSLPLITDVSNPFEGLDLSLQNHNGTIPISSMTSSDLSPNLLVGDWQNVDVSVDNLGLLLEVELVRAKEAREQVLPGFSDRSPAVCGNAISESATFPLLPACISLESSHASALASSLA